MNNVPERFVDGVGEVALKHGVIRIELMSMSAAEAAPVERLIMAIPSFVQMLQRFEQLGQRMAEAGIIRPAEPAQPVAPDSEPGADRVAHKELIPEPRPILAPPSTPNFPRG